MDQIPPQVWTVAHTLIARNETSNSTSTDTSAATADKPPVYKAVGLTLAVCSGVFIGTSFVLKKMGLLKANAKYNETAGEGYGYLKNFWWWGGMTLMIVGELCNFAAYAFVDAILVTPLGALSVVITTILSAIFLKERLSFVGKVGCFNCIIGSVVIVLNAPEQSAVADIQEMKHFVIAPGFLSYAGVVIVACTFIALWAGPRYGKKSMLVYLTICSLIGGLSVVATQGLGSAIIAQAGGKPQFNQWFLYVLLVFVVATLLTEIIYLNKALNLFNAALVTPTYYVIFTSATIITSAILFRGFKGTAVSITTIIMGFFQICAGVVLLQMSKSAKDVPDAAVFKGDLDQVREIAEVEQPETEPKADAIRGAAAIIRRISVSRQKMEQEEARRLRDDRMKDQLEPLRENEIVEWDGLRRRKTVLGENGSGPVRRKTIHPPLGMSHIPDSPDGDEEHGPGFFANLRSRASTALRHQSPGHDGMAEDSMRSPIHPVALTDIKLHPSQVESPVVPYGPGSYEEAQEHIYGLPPGQLRKDRSITIAAQPSPRSKPLPAKPSLSPALRPPQEARRQFSFTNFLRPGSRTPDVDRINTRPAVTHRTSSHERRAMKNGSEEERLGLVKGDSHVALLPHSQSPERTSPSAVYASHSQSSSSSSVDDYYHYPASSPPQRLLSRSDEVDDWQMPPSMSSPRGTRQTSPMHTPTRQQPNPPPIYQPPPLMTRSSPVSEFNSQAFPGTMAGGLSGQDRVNQAVSDPFRSSSMSPPRYTTQDPSSGLRRIGGEDHLPRVSEDARVNEAFEYGPTRTETPEAEETRRRFEEQSRRERDERRNRAAGRRQSWKPDGGNFV
jgi:magnesium transporter